MAIVIQANPNNWQQAWQLSIDTRQSPLPRQISPVLVASPTIAVLASFPSDFFKYRSVGYLSQKIQTGLTVGGNFNARAGRARLVLEGELQVINFEFGGEFALVFDLFNKIADVGSLTVFEYVGPPLEQ